MKERKQFLIPTSLGKGKDASRPPEPGKAWSSSDYFTGRVVEQRNTGQNISGRTSTDPSSAVGLDLSKEAVDGTRSEQSNRDKKNDVSSGPSGLRTHLIVESRTAMRRTPPASDQSGTVVQSKTTGEGRRTKQFKRGKKRVGNSSVSGLKIPLIVENTTAMMRTPTITDQSSRIVQSTAAIGDTQSEQSKRDKKSVGNSGRSGLKIPLIVENTTAMMRTPTATLQSRQVVQSTAAIGGTRSQQSKRDKKSVGKSGRSGLKIPLIIEKITEMMTTPTATDQSSRVVQSTAAIGGKRSQQSKRDKKSVGNSGQRGLRIPLIIENTTAMLRTPTAIDQSNAMALDLSKKTVGRTRREQCNTDKKSVGTFDMSGFRIEEHRTPLLRTPTATDLPSSKTTVDSTRNKQSDRDKKKSVGNFGPSGFKIPLLSTPRDRYGNIIERMVISERDWDSRGERKGNSGIYGGRVETSVGILGNYKERGENTSGNLCCRGGNMANSGNSRERDDARISSQGNYRGDEARMRASVNCTEGDETRIDAQGPSRETDERRGIRVEYGYIGERIGTPRNRERNQRTEMPGKEGHSGDRLRRDRVGSLERVGTIGSSSNSTERCETTGSSGNKRETGEWIGTTGKDGYNRGEQDGSSERGGRIGTPGTRIESGERLGVSAKNRERGEWMGTTGKEAYSRGERISPPRGERISPRTDGDRGERISTPVSSGERSERTVTSSERLGYDEQERMDYSHSPSDRDMYHHRPDERRLFTNFRAFSNERQNDGQFCADDYSPRNRYYSQGRFYDTKEDSHSPSKVREDGDRVWESRTKTASTGPNWSFVDTYENSWQHVSQSERSNTPPETCETAVEMDVHDQRSGYRDSDHRGFHQHGTKWPDELGQLSNDRRTEQTISTIEQRMDEPHKRYHEECSSQIGAKEAEQRLDGKTTGQSQKRVESGAEKTENSKEKEKQSCKEVSDKTIAGAGQSLEGSKKTSTEMDVTSPLEMTNQNIDETVNSSTEQRKNGPCSPTTTNNRLADQNVDETCSTDQTIEGSHQDHTKNDIDVRPGDELIVETKKSRQMDADNQDNTNITLHTSDKSDSYTTNSHQSVVSRERNTLSTSDQSDSSTKNSHNMDVVNQEGNTLSTSDQTDSSTSNSHEMDVVTKEGNMLSTSDQTDSSTSNSHEMDVVTKEGNTLSTSDQTDSSTRNSHDMDVVSQEGNTMNTSDQSDSSTNDQEPKPSHVPDLGASEDLNGKEFKQLSSHTKINSQNSSIELAKLQMKNAVVVLERISLKHGRLVVGSDGIPLNRQCSSTKSGKQGKMKYRTMDKETDDRDDKKGNSSSGSSCSHSVGRQQGSSYVSKTDIRDAGESSKHVKETFNKEVMQDRNNDKDTDDSSCRKRKPSSDSSSSHSSDRNRAVSHVGKTNIGNASENPKHEKQEKMDTTKDKDTDVTISSDRNRKPSSESSSSHSSDRNRGSSDVGKTDKIDTCEPLTHAKQIKSHDDMERTKDKDVQNDRKRKSSSGSSSSHSSDRNRGCSHEGKTDKSDSSDHDLPKDAKHTYSEEKIKKKDGSDRKRKSNNGSSRSCSSDRDGVASHLSKTDKSELPEIKEKDKDDRSARKRKSISGRSSSRSSDRDGAASHPSKTSKRDTHLSKTDKSDSSDLPEHAKHTYSKEQIKEKDKDDRRDGRRRSSSHSSDRNPAASYQGKTDKRDTSELPEHAKHTYSGEKIKARDNRSDRKRTSSSHSSDANEIFSHVRKTDKGDASDSPKRAKQDMITVGIKNKGTDGRSARGRKRKPSSGRSISLAADRNCRSSHVGKTDNSDSSGTKHAKKICRKEIVKDGIKEKDNEDRSDRKRTSSSGSSPSHSSDRKLGSSRVGKTAKGKRRHHGSTEDNSSSSQTRRHRSKGITSGSTSSYMESESSQQTSKDISRSEQSCDVSGLSGTNLFSDWHSGEDGRVNCGGSSRVTESKDDETTGAESRDDETTGIEIKDEITCAEINDGGNTSAVSKDVETTGAESRDDETTGAESRDDETTGIEIKDEMTESNDGGNTGAESKDDETIGTECRDDETIGTECRDDESNESWDDETTGAEIKDEPTGTESNDAGTTGMVVKQEPTEISIGEAHLGQLKNKKHANVKIKDKCNICDKVFMKVGSLQRHMENVHLGKKSHVCDLCGKGYKSTWYLQIHRRIHTGEKPYKCETCAKAFRSLGELQKHHRVHTGEKPYKCTSCEKTFSHLTSLREHLKVHTKERLFKCMYCSKMFVQGQHLKRHVKVHTGEKAYKCDFCGRSFSQLESLRKHHRVHTGEKPYHCDICDRDFSDPRNLKNHRLKHTDDVAEKSHKCDTCGREFVDKRNYHRHLSVHSGEKPHKCETCGKAFRQAIGLKRHLVVHSEEKPYKCGTCGKSFRQAEYLHKHMRVHIEDKPYTCHVCGKKFVCDEYVKKHIKKHNVNPTE